MWADLIFIRKRGKRRFRYNWISSVKHFSVGNNGKSSNHTFTEGGSKSAWERGGRMDRKRERENSDVWMWISTTTRTTTTGQKNALYTEYLLIIGPQWNEIIYMMNCNNLPSKTNKQEWQLSLSCLICRWRCLLWGCDVRKNVSWC